MHKITVIHGPNLHLLGLREPHHYGHQSLASLNAALQQQAQARGFTLHIVQSNHEGVLVEAIHQAREEGVEAIIINPAGLTHTSVVLRDALLAVAIPYIEVHISNIFSRESFRHHSYLSDQAVGLISGLGLQSYTLALDYFIDFLTK